MSHSFSEVSRPDCVKHHSFADDTQTYSHCLPSDVDRVVCQLEGCIIEIDHWMSANRLKLNAE